MLPISLTSLAVAIPWVASKCPRQRKAAAGEGYVPGQAVGQRRWSLGGSLPVGEAS